jgi:gas vesicle protein
MSEEAEIEVKAKEMGWIPKDEFRGDPAKWTDAAEYVARGENLLPIVRAQNRELSGEVKSLREEVKNLRETNAASAEAIQALKDFNSAENRRVLKAQADATRQALIEAKKEGDPEAEVRLTEQLADEKKALETAEAGKTKGYPKPEGRPNGEGEDFTKTADWKAWATDNPWFGADKKRSALAFGVAEELRSDPAHKTLIGRKFLDKVTEEVEKIFNPQQQGRQQSKVEGGARGTGDGGGSGQSYSDLPKDARDICERQATKLVGKGRAFEDIEAWRKHYTKEFFSE